MLSGNSAISTNVHKEVILAQDLGRGIFVVMLEPVKPPAEIRYQLAGLQFIDVQALGFDKSAAQLLSALKEHLKKIKPADEGSQRQTELVIQGIDISAFTAEKQQQLLAFISNLANTDPSQLKIANMTAGSVHVFVNMPSAAAFQLKTMALNRDKRFKEISVTALKLAGDTYYINIALGILTPAAKISPLNALWLRIPSLFSSTFGLTIGKLLTIFLATHSLYRSWGLRIIFDPEPASAFSNIRSHPGSSPRSKSTQTSLPKPTSTPDFHPTLTTTLTPTAENTSTPTVTASPTSSPTPVYGFLDGVVIPTEDRVACRYGPGNPYLYEFELISGNKINAYGKMEIQVQRGDTSELWLYGLAQGYESPCWVNSKYIKLDGDISSLEPYYPDKAPLILFNHPKFPPPKDVNASAMETRSSSHGRVIHWRSVIAKVRIVQFIWWKPGHVRAGKLYSLPLAHIKSLRRSKTKQAVPSLRMVRFSWRTKMAMWVLLKSPGHNS